MKQIRTPLTGTPLALPQTPDLCVAGPLHPADELAQVRLALKKLHARETELRQHFAGDTLANITTPSPSLVGEQHEVTITRHKKRSFDVARLPQAIRANGKFFTTTVQTFVTCKPVQARSTAHSHRLEHARRPARLT